MGLDGKWRCRNKCCTAALWVLVSSQRGNKTRDKMHKPLEASRDSGWEVGTWTVGMDGDGAQKWTKLEITQAESYSSEKEDTQDTLRPIIQNKCCEVVKWRRARWGWWNCRFGDKNGTNGGLLGTRWLCWTVDDLTGASSNEASGRAVSHLGPWIWLNAKENRRMEVPRSKSDRHCGDWLGRLRRPK